MRKTKLYTASNDGTVRIWDASKLREDDDDDEEEEEEEEEAEVKEN